VLVDRRGLSRKADAFANPFRFPANIDTCNLDLSLIRIQKRCEDSDGRRLAGPVRSEETENRSLGNDQIEAVEGNYLVVALNQALGTNHVSQCLTSLSRANGAHGRELEPGFHVLTNSLLFVGGLVLLIAGMFMDPNSAILVFTPLLWPLAQALGVDVIHFGIIITTNLAIGMLTPPFGLNLFVSSSIFKVSASQVAVGLVPFFVSYFIALMIITYVPELSLALPRRVLG
jgi:hypothetical protein